MELPEIIGIAGTNGSGKDTLADLRRDKRGTQKASLSDILRTEASKRGLEHTREVLRSISTQWGRELGAGALALMTIRNYWETRSNDETGLSIVSVRRPAEAAAIQAQQGAVLWVDADQSVRYERIIAASRGRIDDVVTFEEFCEQEDKEMHPPADDPFAVNMAGVRDIADLHLTNDYGSREEYIADLATRFEL